MQNLWKAALDNEARNNFGWETAQGLSFSFWQSLVFWGWGANHHCLWDRPLWSMLKVWYLEMSYNCCPKHLWDLCEYTVTNTMLNYRHHLSCSANCWSLTNKPCKGWLLSLTISIVQACLIPRKIAGLVAPTSCHVFTVPSMWGGKKTADVT